MECRSLGCDASPQINLVFAREEKYEIRQKYEIQPTICLCSQTRRQCSQADPRHQRGWPPSLFSHAGFEALAEDVGSDGDLVGDPNLSLLGCCGCWCCFLLFGSIPALGWGR